MTNKASLKKMLIVVWLFSMLLAIVPFGIFTEYAVCYVATREPGSPYNNLGYNFFSNNHEMIWELFSWFAWYPEKMQNFVHSSSTFDYLLCERISVAMRPESDGWRVVTQFWFWRGLIEYQLIWFSTLLPLALVIRFISSWLTKRIKQKWQWWPV